MKAHQNDGLSIPTVLFHVEANAWRRIARGLGQILLGGRCLDILPNRFTQTETVVPSERETIYILD